MCLPIDCPSCEMGDHTGHDERGTLRSGLIGGHYCPCNGDCAERNGHRARELGQQLTGTKP